MKLAHAAAVLAALAIDSKHVSARPQAADALSERQASGAAGASGLLAPADVSPASAPATIFQTFVTVTTYEKGQTTAARPRDLSKARLARAEEDILTFSTTSEAFITDLTTTDIMSGITEVLPGPPKTDLDLAPGNLTTSTALVGSDIFTITRKVITITETKTITQAGNGTCPIITGPELEPGRGHGPVIGPITSSSTTSRPENATTSFPPTTTTPMNITTSVLTTTTSSSSSTSQLANITSSWTTRPLSTSTVTSQFTTSSTSSRTVAVPLPGPTDPQKPGPGSDRKGEDGKKGDDGRIAPVPPLPLPLCNPFSIGLSWYPKCDQPSVPGLPKQPRPPLALPCIPGDKKCPFPKMPCASGDSGCDVSKIGPPLLCNPSKIPVPGVGPCDTGDFPEIPLPCIPSQEGCVIPPIPPPGEAAPVSPPVAPPVPPPPAPPVPPSPMPPVPPPPGPPVPPPTEPPIPSTVPPAPPPGPTPIAPPIRPEPGFPEIQERACNPETCSPTECQDLARCQDTIKEQRETIRELREIAPGNSVGKTSLQRCLEELTATHEEVIKKDDKIEALKKEVARLKRVAGPRDQAIEDLEGLVSRLEEELEARRPDPAEPENPNPAEPENPNPAEPENPNPAEPKIPNPAEPKNPNLAGPGKPNPAKPGKPNPAEPGKQTECERELRHARNRLGEMERKKARADRLGRAAQKARDEAIQEKDRALGEKEQMEKELKKCKQSGHELSNELEQIQEAWETVRRTGKMKCVFRICLAVKPGPGTSTSPAPPQTGGISRR